MLWFINFKGVLRVSICLKVYEVNNKKPIKHIWGVSSLVFCYVIVHNLAAVKSIVTLKYSFQRFFWRLKDLKVVAANIYP